MGLGPLGGPQEEISAGILPELMTQHPEASRGTAQPSGGLRRGYTLHEIGPQGLVLSMGGVAGLQEDSGQIRLLISWIHRHIHHISCCTACQRKLRKNRRHLKNKIKGGELVRSPVARQGTGGATSTLAKPRAWESRLVLRAEPSGVPAAAGIKRVAGRLRPGSGFLPVYPCLRRRSAGATQSVGVSTPRCRPRPRAAPRVRQVSLRARMTCNTRYGPQDPGCRPGAPSEKVHLNIVCIGK